MEFQDKVLGSWLGLAIGDALAQPVKGLKPETIRQFFKRVEGYRDVRPFIGKGVRLYCMAGLYGALTQCALAMCDVMLLSRRPDPEALAERLLALTAPGPENYFGIFRRPEVSLARTLQSLPQRTVRTRADLPLATGIALPLAVPIALHQQKQTRTLLEGCMEASLLLSRHPWEAVATALTGYLTARFLAMPPPPRGDALGPEERRILVVELDRACGEYEAWFRRTYPGHWALETGESAAMSRTMKGMLKHLDASDAEFQIWICKNASYLSGQSFQHASQGHVLTLFPLALWRVLQADYGFSQGMTDALTLGRAADKLAILVGAWLGAWRGVGNIPIEWRKNLVNAREMRLRGEALARRGKLKDARELIEMESGLTRKEAEERRRFLPLEPAAGKGSAAVPEESGAQPDIASLKKEDPFLWRKFERDKARKKRDRRRHPPEI